MKKKKVLLTALCAAAVSTAICPPMAAFAAGAAQPIMEEEEGGISPRYKYIMMANISLDASDGSYELYIDAISDVTKITGTLTLYKLNSSSQWVKVDSTAVKEYNYEIDLVDSLNNDGPGRYKLTFSGRVYAGTASEPITISIKDSYY